MCGLYLTLMIGATFALTSNAQDPCLRVIQTSPDTPQMRVLVDGAEVIRDVVYRTVSRYYPLASGKHQIDFVIPSSSGPVLSLSVDPAGDQMTTVVVMGHAGSLKPLVLIDRELAGVVAGTTRRSTHRGNQPAAGQSAPNLNAPQRPNPPLGMQNTAYVRVINVAPGSLPLDVAFVTDPVAYLARDLAFGTGAVYMPIVAGTHDIRVSPTGTSTVLTSIPALNVGDLGAFTIFVVGLPDGTGDQALDTLIVSDGMRPPTPEARRQTYGGPPKRENPPLRLPPGKDMPAPPQ